MRPGIEYRSRIAIRNAGGGPPRYPVKEFLAGLRSLVFRGNSVECSCCGGTFSLFMFSPYLTARCPNCLSIERYRLLCRYLAGETDFGEKPARVLDFAPMWCFQEFCRARGKIDYVSVDIASPLAMRHMDIKDLDFPDDMFDWLFCYHVLEHIDDDMAALSELKRVLKPGGRAIIQVPIEVESTVERESLGVADQVRILRWPGHLRAYGKDFAERPRAAGFDVDVCEYVKGFSEDEIKRYGLDPGEDLYICIG